MSQLFTINTQVEKQLESSRVATPDSFRSLRSTWQLLLSYFSQTSFVVIIAAGLVLAFGAELAQPTFHTDSFFEVWFRDAPLDYWTGYGRYLSKFIFIILDRQYPPTFLFLAGLAIMSFVGVMLCELWKVTGKPRAILVLLFCCFPFFFESYSYVPLRYALPMAVAFAVYGAIRGGLYGFISLFAAMLMYQSAANLAAVVVLVWSAAETLQGTSWMVSTKKILVPRLMLIVTAIVLDAYALHAINKYLTPIRLVENDQIRSIDQLAEAARTHLEIIRSFFFESNVFLFPQWTKLIVIVGLLIIVAAVSRMSMSFGNRLFVLTTIAVLPLASHGVSLILAQPAQFIFERVLFAYAGTYVGIFALALLCLPFGKVRKMTICLFAMAALAFVYEANLWHEYMRLKNMADFDEARAMSDRLKANPQFKVNLPLVMVGTAIPKDYLPYRMFHPKQGVIQNTLIDSAFAAGWSNDRILLFFLPFVWPNEQQRGIAQANARDHGVWPASDSAFIRDGIMTVVLSK